MPFTSVDEPSCGGGARVLLFLAANGRPTTSATLCRIEGVVAKIMFRRAGRVALLEKKISSNRRPIDRIVDTAFSKSLAKSRIGVFVLSSSEIPVRY